MELKDYRLEIVNQLLKSESHVRSLASKIGTNHMTVLRKIRLLFKENAIDYREEGKNKVYFIKKNPEARSYVFMAEYYRLIQVIKEYPYLRKVTEKIQKDKNIKLAVLFGSYAKHEAKKDSDVDVYIETKDKKIKQYLERIDSKLSIKIGTYDRKNLLIKEIEKNHVIIKGVEEFYEKNELFG